MEASSTSPTCRTGSSVSSRREAEKSRLLACSDAGGFLLMIHSPKGCLTSCPLPHQPAEGKEKPGLRARFEGQHALQVVQRRRLARRHHLPELVQPYAVAHHRPVE